MIIYSRVIKLRLHFLTCEIIRYGSFMKQISQNLRSEIIDIEEASVILSLGIKFLMVEDIFSGILFT